MVYQFKYQNTTIDNQRLNLQQLYLLEEGHFTVFHHMIERRNIQAELLEFRNRNRVDKRKKVSALHH